MKNFNFYQNNASNIFEVKNHEKNAVLLIVSKYNADGTKTNNVLCVPNLQKTDNVSVVKHLLRCIIAEIRLSYDFNEEFGTYTTDNAEIQKTGIRCRKLFGAYLQTDTIYRTDANGKLFAVLKVADGKLSQTSLSVSASQAIAIEKYNSNAFRALLHTTAKAIIEQCEFVSKIDNEVSEIDNAKKDTETKDTETKDTQKVA